MSSGLSGGTINASGGRARERIAESVQRFYGQVQPNCMMVGVQPLDTENPDKAWFFSEGTVDGVCSPTLTTIWQIGSLTKTFTSSCLALAVLQNWVSLDDGAQAYAPAGVTLPFFDDTAQRVAIRLLDLATHSAGLPTDPRGVPEHGGYSAVQMYEYLGLYALAVPPGIRWNYSNLGFGLLANLLMPVFGVASFDDMNSILLRTYGLDLPDTTTQLNTVQEQRRIRGYSAPNKPAPWSTNTWPAFDGSGALYSSVLDLLVWLNFNLNHLGPQGRALTTMTKEICFRDGAWTMGLGWELSKYGPRQGECWTKGGGTNGFTSYLAFPTELTCGVVIVANAVWAWAEGLAKEILTILSTTD